MGRNVFIADYDLFRDVGGGQTVYGNLIERSPQDQFYYLRVNEPLGAPRPLNAHPIDYRPVYNRATYSGPSVHEPFFETFKDCFNIACSAAHAANTGDAPGFYDVIDTPDYRQNGLFIGRAFAHHGLKTEQVSLALHGVLSDALRSAWPWSGSGDRLFAGLVLKERLQHRVVDSRYALSPFYAEALQRQAGLPIAVFDPLTVIRETAPTRSALGNTAPELVFVGRKEKRKGPDLCVELAWSLPPGLISGVRLIGPDGVNHQGSGSAGVLARAARWRGLTISDEPPLNQASLRALCRARTILITPSRYDQFNLTALEALLDGCPTLVGENTGVARFIEHRLPELSFLVDNFSNARRATHVLQEIAQDYDAARSRVVEIVQRAGLAPDFASLGAIYDARSSQDRTIREQIDALFSRYLLFATDLAGESGSPERAPVKPEATAANKGAAKALADRLRSHAPRLAFALEHPAPAVRRAGQIALDAMAPPGRRSVAAMTSISMVESLAGVHQRLQTASERTEHQIGEKIGYLNMLVGERRVGRVRWFAELARLERLRGQDLIAATYDLRIMRWLGADVLQRLPLAAGALERHGFAIEARFAEAQWSARDAAETDLAALLSKQADRWRKLQPTTWAQLENRRGTKPPKISVIVSLYQTGPKLQTFLDRTLQQTAFVEGHAELILIDSASPDQPWERIREHLALQSAPYIFGRSATRETIQSAWNRGIGLANGEYLAFLGVDEGLRTDGLMRLAQALDEEPSADWAMADSLVTRVDQDGVLDADVMAYNRADYSKEHAYLESTYLAYVGGLYRKALHDRVGYYDEDFRAAGDTEFKNRALPDLKVVRVPEVLGVFSDYPEVRMSNHPRAELEDLRAWYAHRSTAGLERAYPPGQEAGLERLVALGLDYQKSFLDHRSTDIDLAVAAARVLTHRSEAPIWLERLKRLEGLQADYRRLEVWPAAAPHGGERAFAAQVVQQQRNARWLGKSLGVNVPDLKIFNDNRYEQHGWSWSVVA